MIYFGENNDYIMCECEVCKREIYAERESIAVEDAYSYHISQPLKCSCGNIDEYINKAKKACYHIRQELSALSDLLHKQQGVASRISGINAEINKRFNPPTFWQSLAGDFLFAGKIFLIILGSVIGLEIFLFIITLLMFFGGMAFQLPDLSRAGNELFYNLNIFKDRGGAFLSIFGFDADYPPFDAELAQEQIIFGYIPYAIAGVFVIIFYIFLAIFIIKASINITKLTIFASRVMNQKINVVRRREAYERELGELKREYNGLDVRIDELDILGRDYKNARAVDMILKYFINNRVDSVREAVNLYHEDDFKSKQLEYSKAMYTEAKQTRRYTKAMYMLTSDNNIKVEVRDEPAEPAQRPAAPILKPKKLSLRKNINIIAGIIKAPITRKKALSEDYETEEPLQEDPDNEEIKNEELNETDDNQEISGTETFSSIFEAEQPEESIQE